MIDQLTFGEFIKLANIKHNSQRHIQDISNISHPDFFLSGIEIKFYQLKLIQLDNVTIKEVNYPRIRLYEVWFNIIYTVKGSWYLNVMDTCNASSLICGEKSVYDYGDERLTNN